MNGIPTDQTIAIALRHLQSGNVAFAEKLYRQVLAQRADHPESLHMLGVIAAQRGQLDTARDLVQRAIAGLPENAFYHGSLGNILQDMGRFEESIASFRRAIELNPDLAEAHNNLGNVLKITGQVGEAINSYRNALRLKPDEARFHYNLAEVLKRSGELSQAIDSYRQATVLAPAYFNAHINLGNALKDDRQFQEAIGSYRNAIRLQPSSAEAHINLGTALREDGQLDDAIASDRTAVRLKPNLAEAHANLGLDLKETGQLDEAIASYRQALKLKPDFEKAHSHLVFTLNYHPALDAETICKEHRAWGDRYARRLTMEAAPHLDDPSPDRRLRIGYVSGDFRAHSVAYFFNPILEHRNRQMFEIICFANLHRPAEMTNRMKAQSDGWRSIFGLSDDAVAQMIRSDGIDILVDLSGHTSGNRLAVFARKPAPIQVTYLGYPNTTGMAAIDYRLTDALADPPGMTEELCVETLWRLPGCAWCYQPHQGAPEISPRGCGPVTFGCFNAFAKINRELVGIWAQILNRVPGSRLLLKSAGAGEKSSRRRLVDQLAEHGIAADRIETRGRISDAREHLELYNQVDVALDTFPYHGTTTTCEALWMGVPVVTLAGITHVSRVGVSLLTSARLREFIAQTPEEYISIASELGSNPARLLSLRAGLRANLKASLLMDGKSFAAGLDAAYRQMWSKWCERAVMDSGIPRG